MLLLICAAKPYKLSLGKGVIIMTRKWLKKTFGVVVGVQTGLALLSGNLQTFAGSATEITAATTVGDGEKLTG